MEDILPFGLRLVLSQYCNLVHQDDMDIIQSSYENLMYDSIISDNIVRFKLYHSLCHHLPSDLGYLCCKYNSIQCLEYIITKCAITPQMVEYAIHANNTHILRLMVRCGLCPSLNMYNLILMKYEESLQVLCEFGYKKEDGCFLTQYAVELNDSRCLRILLLAGYKQNANATSYAAERGYQDCLELLLQNNNHHS